MLVVIAAGAYYPSHASGADRLAYDEAVFLAARGHDVWLVCRAEQEGEPDHTVERGVHVLRYRSRRIREVRPSTRRRPPTLDGSGFGPPPRGRRGPYSRTLAPAAQRGGRAPRRRRSLRPTRCTPRCGWSSRRPAAARADRSGCACRWRRGCWGGWNAPRCAGRASSRRTPRTRGSFSARCTGGRFATGRPWSRGGWTSSASDRRGSRSGQAPFRLAGRPPGAAHGAPAGAAHGAGSASFKRRPCCGRLATSSAWLSAVPAPCAGVSKRWSASWASASIVSFAGFIAEETLPSMYGRRRRLRAPDLGVGVLRAAGGGIPRVRPAGARRAGGRHPGVAAALRARLAGRRSPRRRRSPSCWPAS